MKWSIKTSPTRWDALVAAGVVLAAVVCAAAVWRGQTNGGLTAVFSVDGHETERVELAKNQDRERTMQANGYTLHLVLSETEVWMEQADCPTQDCVHTGHISRAGQSIVCLPARVSVQLVGGAAEDGVDAVLG